MYTGDRIQPLKSQTSSFITNFIFSSFYWSLLFVISCLFHGFNITRREYCLFRYFHINFTQLFCSKNSAATYFLRSAAEHDLQNSPRCSGGGAKPNQFMIYFLTDHCLSAILIFSIRPPVIYGP